MKLLFVCILCLGLLTMSACKETEIESKYSVSAESDMTSSSEASATSSQDTTTEIEYSSEERSSDTESKKESKPIYSSEVKASSKENSVTETSSESYEISSAASSVESEVEEKTYATKEDAPVIAEKIVEYINNFRISEGKNAAINLSGLTEYAEYRSRQLVSNFAHDTKDERAAATALKYGQYVDPTLFGMTGEPYYTANCGEAIAKADFAGTVESVAERFARLTKNSPDHWSYVGSEQYRYIAVGITYENGVWYCCIAVTINNSDEQ